MLPYNLQEIQASIDPRYSISGWAPIPYSLVLKRAYASRGRGYYKLGGGSIFTALDVFGPEKNQYPGTCDCSGFVAWVLAYKRGRWNTDAITTDAIKDQTRFRRLALNERPRPGDVIVKPGPDLDGNNIRDRPGHVGIITWVAPDFVQGEKEWWKKIAITHCSGRLQYTTDPTTGQVYGAVRTTDASSWKDVAYFVRPKHVIGPSISTIPIRDSIPWKKLGGGAAIGVSLFVLFMMARGAYGAYRLPAAR